MQTISSLDAMRQFSSEARCAGRRIALVPTMGALHEGHLHLVDEARRNADDVVVSIFVNPTQFGPSEDYERYPRAVEDDLEMLRHRGVSAAFVPSVETMYPDGVAAPPVRITVQRLTENLCGRHRPGHFDGVVQVVTRLLLIVLPDVAVFGLKDAQQFVIIKALVRSLGLSIEIVGLETVRENDGLAMSSRNRYLSPGERKAARMLSRAVKRAHEAVVNGEQEARVVVTSMLHTLEAEDSLRIQYAEVVDANGLDLIERIQPGQDILIAVAAHIGNTRLIDSAFVTAPV